MRLSASQSLDAVRAARLLELRSLHPGAKIVAFSQYADTVRALRARLRLTPGVAALTAAGAEVAGGRMSRQEALARFAPLALGVAVPRGVERIDLLLTTDLLSEGVNLQDASVVVHLDLPWTPARLEQRVGRVRRLGSSHSSVAVYAFAPPASAERLVRLEERLRDKLGAADNAVGFSSMILPAHAAHPTRAGLAVARAAPTDVALMESLRHALERWCTTEPPRPARDRPSHSVFGAVASTESGWLALLESARGAELLARVGGETGNAPALLCRAVALALGADVAVDATAIDRVVAEIDQWTAARDGRTLCGLTAASAPARSHVVRRLAAIVARATAGERVRLAPLVSRARLAATARYGVDAETALSELTSANLSDIEWLVALGAFSDAHAAPPLPLPGRVRPAIVALLLLEKS